MSYAAILKDLKKRIKPDELGVTVQGIIETRSKDLLMELKCFKEGKGWLDTALREAIGASGTVLHLILRIEIEITQSYPHKNRVGLLQGLPKDESKSVLPLFSFWPHGGELPGAQPKLKLLKVCRRGARCEFLRKETAVLTLLRYKR